LSGDAIRIRAYAPSDLDALIALFRNAARATAPRHYSQAQVMAWAPDDIDRDSWISRCAGRPTWIAERDGVPVGFVEILPSGHIDMLYTQPLCQGMGVASALLRRVETAARKQGLPRLFTEASVTARPFFERRGFRVIAAQTVTRRGETFTNYRTEKELS
jgi:putative acetyltransferase